MPVFALTENSIGFSVATARDVYRPPDELLGISAAKFFEITVGDDLERDRSSDRLALGDPGSAPLARCKRAAVAVLEAADDRDTVLDTFTPRPPPRLSASPCRPSRL